MVVIRLARGGAKKSPFYQIVAADSRRARDSRFIEKLGYFNPLARGKAIRMTLNQDRVQYWMSQGAQPSERVASLLKTFKATSATAEAVQTRAEVRKAQSEAAQSAHHAKKEAAGSEEAAVSPAEDQAE